MIHYLAFWRLISSTWQHWAALKFLEAWQLQIAQVIQWSLQSVTSFIRPTGGRTEVHRLGRHSQRDSTGNNRRYHLHQRPPLARGEDDSCTLTARRLIPYLPSEEAVGYLAFNKCLYWLKFSPFVYMVGFNCDGHPHPCKGKFSVLETNKQGQRWWERLPLIVW